MDEIPQDQPLEPVDPKAFAAKEAEQKREMSVHKNRAIIPALRAIADEVERRNKSGQLARELKKVKVGSLLGNLTRIITAIKDTQPIIVAQGKQEVTPEDTWLRAQSAANVTPYERNKRRKEILEAETVDEKP